jgi:hypothetical protein
MCQVCNSTLPQLYGARDCGWDLNLGLYVERARKQA